MLAIVYCYITPKSLTDGKHSIQNINTPALYRLSWLRKQYKYKKTTAKSLLDKLELQMIRHLKFTNLQDLRKL